MAEYTYKELMKMQNDAIRRAEDMKNRAQRQAGLSQTDTQTKEVPIDKPKRIPMPSDYLNIQKNESRENTDKPAVSHSSSNNFFETIKRNFNDINIDSDRALLLSLILLLAEEKADETLIMALLYML